MKLTPLRVIPLVNIILALLTYIALRNAYGYVIIPWLFLTSLLIGGNLILAIFVLIMRMFSNPADPGQPVPLKGLALSFLLSAGLVLLVSYPLCLALSEIRY